VSVTTLKQALAAPRAALPGSAASQDMRAGALAELGATGLPTPRREDWRYTDLKPLTDAELDFAPRGPDRKTLDAAARALAEHGVPADVPRLVFVDGHLAPELGSLDSASGIEVRDLDAYWLRPDAARRTQVSTSAHPLAALNTAYAQSGAWIRVADGARIAGEIRLVLVASGAPKVVAQPRIVVEIGRGAEVTIVQHIVDAAETDGWLNVVTEIALGEDSRLTLYRLEEHCLRRAHTSLLAVDIAARAIASLGLFDLGGRLVRNDVDVKLREPGAALDLYGLLLAGEGQHVDDHTRIDHIAPDTRSNEAFRAVIGKRGRGVFNGKVVVHRGARGIDAQQTSDNLLLSDQAEIDTKPELQIHSDDVKCSHGSTVGELDAEHLFYLRARGLEEAHAREILTTAFAATVIERIAAQDIRARVADKVGARLRTLVEVSR
jgi:Fe-S cluster assembly protein SufD